MLAKSNQEKERLLMAAKAQAVLLNASIGKQNPTPKPDHIKPDDLIESEGHIDYTKYTKRSKK